MKYDSIKFEFKDVIKIVGGALTICAMWYDLKTDLQIFKATTEIRLSALEGDNRSMAMSKPQSCAILPNQIKLEDDK